jgi:hypothetical protein
VVPDGSTPASSADSENTAAGEAPGPIPYARFKEVNDARRTLEEAITPYRELEGIGYGADDLHRLASWEQEYAQDPAGWLMEQLAQQEQIDPSVKAAIEAAKGNGDATATAPAVGDATPTDQTPTDEPPSWAKPLVEDLQSRQLAAEREATVQLMDSLEEAWQKIDAQQDVTTPRTAMLTYLQVAGAQFSEPIDVLRAAREQFIADRSEMLGDVVKAKNGPTPPHAVPGSGGGDAPVTPPPRPRTLDEARRAAEEADARGALVPNYDT